MFVLQKEPRWTWPVTVREPDDKGGFTSRSFSAVWRLLPKQTMAELGKDEPGTDELLRRMIVEIREIQDDQGNAVPHSPELVDALIAIPWVRRGFIEAYAEAIDRKSVV